MALRAPRTVDLEAFPELGSGIDGQLELVGARDRRQQHDEQHGHRSDTAWAGTHPGHHTEGMGLDPTRPHRKGRLDYAFVAGALVVGVALVVWALFG